MTYLLRRTRLACPIHQPYFAPDLAACAITCNVGFFANDAAGRCEACPRRCLKCKTWSNCQICEASQWNRPYVVGLVNGRCQVMPVPWPILAASVAGGVVVLSVCCRCCGWCCVGQRKRRKGAAGKVA